MNRVFQQQWVVVKELKRHFLSIRDPLIQALRPKESEGTRYQQTMDCVEDIDLLLELIGSRKAEIEDLEDSVQRVTRQVRFYLLQSLRHCA